ncbi:MAG: Asp-tRNA(Asn)/Glu-tRNA(Gln) amidotransferase GatCAB subunit A [Legionellales bacterium]|nr:Asp-tRNA(Asn)/Glu-tRNA(Gln) amidotransferase GatCAB subunit A [Legionellales bacterium]
MYKTLSEIKQALESKAVSSLELITHYLGVIQQLNPSLNAMISVHEQAAIEAAKQCDQLRASRSADTLPALCGLPIIHKDIFCTVQSKTTCGSQMLANFEPHYDATIVSRLRQAGMIQLGNANMDEFAMGSSNETSFFGPCYNPWSLSHVPGGSSGGSAAAVSAGFSPVASGTDTGGSIRQPAAFCGVTGLKPTYGTLSRYGMVAFASTLDQAGYFANDMRDIALLLDHSAGQDPNDSTTRNYPEPNGIAAEQVGDKPLTIGVPAFMSDHSLPAAISHAFDETLAVFKRLGYSVQTVELPHSQYAVPTYYVIAPAECSSNLARYDGVKYGFRSSNSHNLESLYVNTRTEAFGEEVKRRILLGTFALSSGYYDAYYEQASKVRTLIKRDFEQAFNNVDLILTPTTPSTAFKVGEKTSDPIAMYQSDLYTLPASLAGLPAASFPAGFSEGLPIGMHLAANRCMERYLIQSVARFQQETDWHLKQPNIERDTP